MGILDAAFETLKEKGYTDEQIQKLIIKLIEGQNHKDITQNYFASLNKN